MQVEKIKRLNKLWTNDSLFLRDAIWIPFNSPPKEFTLDSDSEDDDAADLKNIEILLKERKTQNKAKRIKENTSVSDEVFMDSQKEKENKNCAQNTNLDTIESCSDFFSKMDNRIKTFKDKFQKNR